MNARILIFLLSLLHLSSCFKSNAESAHDGKVPEQVAQPTGGDEIGENEPTLINGEELDKAQWPYVVRIQTGNAGCTATVVGPKVVITAAHCGNNGATSKFTIAGKTYSGKITRSPLYPRKDHDLAVILLTEPVAKEVVKTYAHVGGKPEVGKKAYLAGYGCVRPGGGGGNDGVLRGGYATITGSSGYDIVSGRNGEAALCFGDSGGPMFTDKTPVTPVLMGVNSKGNIRNTNYNLDLTSSASQSFLVKIADDNGVEICGVKGSEATCGNGGNPDPEPSPEPQPEPCDAAKKKSVLHEIAVCLGVNAAFTMPDEL